MSLSGARGAAEIGEALARVDFAYPEEKLVIELDGYGFHSDPASFVRDRERQNRLQMAGFRVLRYTARDLIQRREGLIAELREALAFREAPMSTEGASRRPGPLATAGRDAEQGAV